MYKVLYLGDTSLNAAAGYLGGVLEYFQIEFDYLESDKAFDNKFLDNHYDSIIISDYPSANFNSAQLDKLSQNISNGTGLLMIGGWESFTGLQGGYNQTIIKDILPVEMSKSDDRFNTAHQCIIKKEQNHTIIETLPFEQYCPSISGFNALTAKKDATTILSTIVHQCRLEANELVFYKKQIFPLLTVGKYYQSNVAAYASDATPHWVGGFVDWGNSRIQIQAKGGEILEVGNWYAKFFCNLIKWTIKE
jgi:uncharacterized membrane protein